VAAVIPAERFQANGFYWQVYKTEIGSDYTALAKTVPFKHFGKPLLEPWDDDVWFEFGVSAEEAYTRLRLSMGLEVAK
jgi:hypothetical protein